MNLKFACFVTGTDTGVGKTVTSAALVCCLRPIRPVRYWKPIQTGIDPTQTPEAPRGPRPDTDDGSGAGIDDDTATVRWLSAAHDDEVLDAGVRLPRPVSPHLAARSAGVTLRVAEVVSSWRARAVEDGRAWIVEGAGGVMTTWDGQPAKNGGCIVAAGDKRVHAEAMKLLNGA